MKTNKWYVIGAVAVVVGGAVVARRAVRRWLYAGGRELPPPDRVIEGGQPATPSLSPSVSSPPRPALSPVAPESVAPDKDMPDEPPPPPEPDPIVIATVPSFDTATGGAASQDAERLWGLLQQEAYRQRGEGYRKEWAFHLYATKHSLGVPLARSANASQRLTVNGKQYGFQVFARDTLFNEIPKWGEVQRLSTLLGGKMPKEGLALALLEASYRAVGTELHPNWAFHRSAIEHHLGPALGPNYSIKVEGVEYTMQVFGCDTLYTPVPDWSDVRRLSETPDGTLREVLLAETYKVAGAPYNPQSAFSQLARQDHIGTPLSDMHTVDLGGTPFTVQVFSLDTLSAAPGDEPSRQSSLLAAAVPDDVDRADTTTTTTEPAIGTPDDALSSKRPAFALLPVTGEPRISQLYGYTKWAAGGGRKYYGACQGRHPGIDFAVPEGTPLLAIDHGVVVCAGVANKDCPFGGSPPMIAIVRYGSIYAIYGHASRVNVRKGQRVAPGDVVCWSGNYGGPHLHFELRPVPDNLLANTDPNQPAQNPGYAVNPLDYFNAEMQAYFEMWYQKLGGASHFCAGTLRDQARIQFGGPVDTRPCTNG